VECIEDLACASNNCCLNVCCDNGQVCFDELFSQVSIAAAVGCCTPGGCPTLFLGDQCGSGLIETDCGTILTQECPCDGELNLDCFAGFCCRPSGGDCSTPSDCCFDTVCNTLGTCGCIALDGACTIDSDCCSFEPCKNGFCGCRDEGEACGITDDCCNGFCFDFTCVPCFDEFQGPCSSGDDCCNSGFCDPSTQECRRQ
jgi:hypothetical protein